MTKLSRMQVGIRATDNNGFATRIFFSNEVTDKLHIRIDGKSYWIDSEDMIKALNDLFCNEAGIENGSSPKHARIEA